MKTVIEFGAAIRRYIYADRPSYNVLEKKYSYFPVYFSIVNKTTFCKKSYPAMNSPSLKLPVHLRLNACYLQKTAFSHRCYRCLCNK
jgi:hypothetical protein